MGNYICQIKTKPTVTRLNYLNIFNKVLKSWSIIPALPMT